MNANQVTPGSQATPEAPYCPAPDRDPRPPRHPFPAGACESHAHVCGPEAQFKYDPARIYTPHDSLLSEFEHMVRTLGAERMVLVQPSVYGFDNQVMLKAMREATIPVRGVAVLPTDTSDKELETLHAAGVRGIRFNVVDLKDPTGEVDLDAIGGFAERVKSLGWHVELLLRIDDYADLAGMFRDFPTEIVLCHLGYFHPGCPVEHPSFQALLDLAESGRCWVKMTGPYRISAQPFPHPDITPHAKALVSRAPHRLIWGTDWPHVINKMAMPNDGDLADLLAQWVPDEAVRRRILVDNPCRLYQF